MNGQKALTTTLELDTLDELFTAPTVSPLAGNYRPHSYTSAVEFIAGELHANTSVEHVEATFVLPSAEAERAASLNLGAAVGRYAAARLRDIEQDLRGTYWRGRRAIAMAIAAMFFFVGLGSIIQQYDGLIAEIIGEGFFIAGWVALWVPLEMWFFDAWQHRLDRRIWRVVSNMHITVVAGPSDEDLGQALAAL